MSLKELVATLAQVAAEFDWPIVTVERHPEIPPSGPRHLELGITRARTKLGWTPLYSLAEELREYAAACAAAQRLLTVDGQRL